MHVTVVGAGVLGRIYGVRLAVSGDRVAFVVRESRLTERSPYVIEQVNGSRRRDAVDEPVRVARIPASTEVVILAVRFDQLESEGSPLIGVIREAPRVPLVSLTPMLPGPRAAVERALGRRLIAAMPGAAGYLDDRDVVRYWLSPLATTLVEDDPSDAGGAAMDALLARLNKSGLATHEERDVGSLNAATTTAFFPLIAAIGAAGGVEKVLADADFFATVIEAAHESDALGRRLGKVASWAHLLTRFVGPYTLKPAVALARTLAPEALRFADVHFGPKLHDQHVAMGEAILALAAQEKHPMPALGRLMDRLRLNGAGKA